jgi:anti-sigma B factor antagonist
MDEPNGSGLGDDPVAGVERSDGAVVVRLTGELDLHNAPAIRKALFALAEEKPNRLIIDLADVEFMDSTALGVLVEARTKLVNRRAFLLASPGLETHRALQISGLAQHLSVHESVESALHAPVT